ncbi:hypothetical protein BD309DRAFT_369400 [Dichomitus squalens]|nr:hypothetical protein BD309DRAFT_369400 [Dichomitus squalens]
MHRSRHPQRAFFSTWSRLCTFTSSPGTCRHYHLPYGTAIHHATWKENPSKCPYRDGDSPVLPPARQTGIRKYRSQSNTFTPHLVTRPTWRRCSSTLRGLTRRSPISCPFCCSSLSLLFKTILRTRKIGSRAFNCTDTVSSFRVRADGAREYAVVFRMEQNSSETRGASGLLYSDSEMHNSAASTRGGTGQASSRGKGDGYEGT